MNFTQAVQNQVSRTENGMKAFKSSSNSCVDFFYSVGASRGKDVIPSFVAAYVENRELALRIAQWARDVRGGAGERQIFRDILKYLEIHSPMDAITLLNKVPELGRWDDLLGMNNPVVRGHAYGLVVDALYRGNKLCAKWMPRKGNESVALRNFMRLSPKAYRKLLVNLSQVVETQMCAKTWDSIEFSHVPSLAHARYKKAFNRNTPKYSEYVKSLLKDDSDTKVNATAVYPYDVIKGMNHYSSYDETELSLIIKQWEALPNFIGKHNILPMVDVSGSMSCAVGGNKNLRCIDVAVSLGLYCADKNTGSFNGTFLTFSQNPELIHLSGNIVQKFAQMNSSDWGMNTNLLLAFDKIIETAVNGKVPEADMPKILLSMSDMQFDQCTIFDDSAFAAVNRKFSNAGYNLPKIVFWNLRATDNIPVKANENGVALVSGFSPAIMASILKADLDSFTPESIMLNTIMDERYDIA